MVEVKGGRCMFVCQTARLQQPSLDVLSVAHPADPIRQEVWAGSTPLTSTLGFPSLCLLPGLCLYDMNGKRTR